MNQDCAPGESIGCEYCGLPVRSLDRPASPAQDARAEPAEPVFCCLGCRIAQEITHGSSDSGLSKSAFFLGLAVFFSMNVMVFTMVLWSWDTYPIASSENATVFKELLRFACLLFATPVVLILGRPLVEMMLAQFRNCIFSADGLLLVGVLAAFGYSVMSLFSGGEHIYFEVACMILLAVTIGRWMESQGKQRATKSLATLQNLLPDSATVIGGSSEETVALSEVLVGSHIRVRPGERVPLDGTVVAGKSFVDKRLITGESEFCTVSVGDAVFGGFANIDGTLAVEVTATVDDGVIQRLVSAVNSAVGNKSRPERLADRMAAALALLIIVVSTSVFIWHYRDSGIQSALMASMAVVLIACPCALAVATPLAIWSALSAAASRGIVFRTSDDLLQLGRVDHVCFDKTGTITTGEPWLVKSWIDPDTEEGLPSTSEIVRSICLHSVHPLAVAAMADLRKEAESTEVHHVDQIQSIPGRGLVGVLALPGKPSGDGVRVVLGNERHCSAEGVAIPPAAKQAIADASNSGYSLLLAGWNAEVKAVMAFDEKVRERVNDAFTELKHLGVSMSVLTGDHSARANRLADELKLRVTSELLPQDKLTHVEQLKERVAKRAASKAGLASLAGTSRHAPAIVAMVGDGLNDAPALAAADVGIAMGCGTEITRDAADVCLLSSELSLIPWAIELSRETRKNISRNLFWSVAYNCLGVVLAATGRLNPIFAAAAMVLSSVFVISNSLRLLNDNEASESTYTENQQADSTVVGSLNVVSVGGREGTAQLKGELVQASVVEFANHE